MLADYNAQIVFKRQKFISSGGKRENNVCIVSVAQGPNEAVTCKLEVMTS